MLRIRTRQGTGFAGCLVVIMVLAINATLGGACFDYALGAVVGKDIPWYGDAVAGFFLGQFAVPAALICWIVTLCGVAVPFIH